MYTRNRKLFLLITALVEAATGLVFFFCQRFCLLVYLG
jgi:hypothetical protein